MGISDVVIMTLIISGAIYLLYRSIWKKQGHCPGCDVGACELRSGKKGVDCR